MTVVSRFDFVGHSAALIAMTLYRKFLVFFAVAAFYTGVPEYLNTLIIDAAPMYWVMLCALLALPLLVRELAKPDLLKCPLILWCFGYAWVTMAWFLLSPQSDPALQELRWRGMMIIELLLFLTLFTQIDAHRLARQALVAGVLLGVALNIYEVFVPLSFSPFIGRSAGLYLNPNTAGETLVLGMVFGLTVLSRPWQGPFMLLTGAGVFITYSRSSILAWLIAVAGLVLMGKVRAKDLFLSVLISSLLVILVLLPRWDQLLTTLERERVLNKDVLERMEWLMDPSGVSDKSSWERKMLAKREWEKIADHPFLGSGTGASRSSSISIEESHNLYLSLMRDHGILGVMILPLLTIAVVWRARGECWQIGMIFSCIILMRGFFSHHILGQLQTLLLFSLMAAMTLTSRASERAATRPMTQDERAAPKVSVGASSPAQ
jgi:hypothetical protein